MSSDDVNGELTALVLRDIADHLARGEALIDGDWQPYTPREHSRWGAKYRRGYSDRGLVAVNALRQIAKMNEAPSASVLGAESALPAHRRRASPRPKPTASDRSSSPAGGTQ